MPDRSSFADRRHDAAMSAIADRAQPGEEHLTPAAIKRCTLCDDDGYRNGVVCDHVNRTNVGRPQRDHIRKMLANKSNNRGRNSTPNVANADGGAS